MDSNYRNNIMNEIKPFKKQADPEVEKRAKDRERIAQFYYDCIMCDLPLSDMRALAEARGLSLDDVLMAATIKRFFDIKHMSSSINARSIEKPKGPCDLDQNPDPKDLPSQNEMFLDNYESINVKGDFHPMLDNYVKKCANKCKHGR